MKLEKKQKFINHFERQKQHFAILEKLTRNLLVNEVYILINIIYSQQNYMLFYLLKF